MPAKIPFNVDYEFEYGKLEQITPLIRQLRKREASSNPEVGVPVFAYKGVAANGKASNGLLDAETQRAARTKLRRDGIFLTELVERTGVATVEAAAGRSFELPSFQRVPPLDLALVTRQAATLLSAGIPLIEGLTALTEQTENVKLRSALGQARDRVNEGAHFADALAETGVFPDLYISMVRAGEAGGALEIVLERLADYLESQVRLRNKVSSILIYPSVMLAFAVLVVGVLVTGQADIAHRENI